MPLSKERKPLFAWKQYREEPEAYAADLARWESDGVWETASGVGVLTEFSGLLVVDVDVLIELASQHLSDVTGSTVSIEGISHGVSRTKSGRVHLFFEAGDEPAERLRTISKQVAAEIGCHHVEIKHQGACVPLPPTETTVGGYEWHGGRFPYHTADGALRLTPPPPWVGVMYDRLEARCRERDDARDTDHDHLRREREAYIREARASGRPVRVETAAEEQARALAYQAKVDPAYEGERHVKLVHVAGCLCKNGFSTDALRVAAEAYNARCTPPLPDDEVRRILKDAEKWITHTPQEVIEERMAATSDPEEWPPPQPLEPTLPAVEPFEISLLPGAFADLVEDAAERMQCPIEFLAVALVVGLSSVVGRQLAIRPKREDDWTVVPNLWGAVVGRPGVLKTPALQEMMRPLDLMDARAREEHEEALQGHKASKVVADERLRLARKEIQKALKLEGDSHTIALKAIKAEDGAPPRRRYVINDPTVEKLGEILHDNPRGVLLYRDELTGFLRSLDREGRESDRAFYLEAWNGTGRYSYDRIGRGTIDIEAACVSILGGIQPGPLSEYVARAVRGGGDDDGLLQRFQLIFWPDVSGPWRNVDRRPNAEARQRADRVFQRLDSIDPATVDAYVPADEGGLPFVRFGPEAQDIFDEWRSKLEERLRAGDLPPLLEAHLAKYRSLIPSLALLIHLADSGQGPVTDEALLRACRWGDVLESHARRVYAHALSPALVGAKELLKHILGGDLGMEFAGRDVQQKGWSGLGNKDLIEQALGVLEEQDWVRVERTRTRGAPKTRCFVNPRRPTGSE